MFGLFTSTQLEREVYATIRSKPLKKERFKPHVFKWDGRWLVIPATRTPKNGN